jgi:hypothetical protein
LDKETNIGRVKSLTWLLERNKSFQGQFEGPTAGMNITTNNLVLAGPDLDKARATLDQAKKLPYRSTE